MANQSVCPHGFTAEDNSPPADMAFAAPFGHCRCCGADFPYIGMATYTGGGDVDRCAPDPTLCIPCGGKPTVERRNDSEHYYDPGTALSDHGLSEAGDGEVTGATTAPASESPYRGPAWPTFTALAVAIALWGVIILGILWLTNAL